MHTVAVSRRGADRWRRGHPWIYRSDVLHPQGDPAGAVRVIGPDGSELGVALWSPASTISLRFLAPAGTHPGPDLWRDRLLAARRYREALAPDASAYRLVHAEADGLPSLVVDRYDEILVAQILSAGLETFRDDIVRALIDVFGPAGILARNDVPVRSHENLAREVEVLWGRVPDGVEVREHGVRYRTELKGGQKTGAFLDQRENRTRAGELARGRALDCFSYHGSFALHLAGTAAEVVAVDSSADAVARARENAALNGFDHVRAVEGNVFEFLRAEESAGERYDTIVLDPPAFAKQRRSIDAAVRGYKEINLRAMRLLEPGGILCTFSCSHHVSRALFREMLQAAAADAGRPVRLLEERGQALDHPEVLQIPESGYLKGAILQAV